MTTTTEEVGPPLEDVFDHQRGIVHQRRWGYLVPLCGWVRPEQVRTPEANGEGTWHVHREREEFTQCSTCAFRARG